MLIFNFRKRTIELQVFFLAIIALCIGCADSNQEYIQQIKEQLKEEALGIDLNYENLQFAWVDTLYAKERLEEVEHELDRRLNTLIELKIARYTGLFEDDNLKKVQLFSKGYLTKERLLDLRNWENKNRGEMPYPEYEDYYEYAFDNREDSDWLSELCTQIEKTDSLLNRYEKLEEGNLALMETALWYYQRIENFYSNHSPNKIWSDISSEIDQLKALKEEANALSTIPPDNVIHYKALNTYKINNPLFNGAEQEIQKYFIFNDELELIGSQDVDSDDS